MVRMQLESIAQEAIDLNLAKAGYTAFYVDGTNGLDTYPGDSWEQPFKTIQHAVDEAGSWAKIFVKVGTYTESVSLSASKHSIHIIGEKKETTIITISGAAALCSYADSCIIDGFTLATVTSGAYVITGYADHNIFRNCIIDPFHNGIVMGGDYNEIENITQSKINSACPSIILSGSYNKIHGCNIKAWLGIDVTGNNNEVFENDVKDCSDKGISVVGDDNNTFHNNLLSNGTQVEGSGSDNKWFENYHDDHTTDTNNDGLCDSAYSFTGGTDYQPVSRRNGWKQESLGYDSGIGGGASITDNAFSSATSQDYTTEKTVFEIAVDTRYKIIGVWIDITPFTAADTITFQFYRAIDAAGATYRKAGAAISKVKGTDNPIVEFADFAHYGYTKITAISSPGRTVVVPFGYIKEALE